MFTSKQNSALEARTSKHIFQAKCIAEIEETLQTLREREVSVIAKLTRLVSSQTELSRQLGRLDILRAHLGTQVINTRAIRNGMLSTASSTASRISGAVKRLDLEQSRIKATLQVVEQVSELKTCVLGVHGSMGAPQDWETAAEYLNHACKIPDKVIDSNFAEEIVRTAEVPDPPRVTLENAAESLCGLFLREFNKAAKEGDVATLTRFFKLFPLIGRADVGLDAYGQFVCQGVAGQARANLNAGTGGAQRKERSFYANALTKLFEQIALIVDRHGSLVEQHYGPGRMIKVVERLQAEADVQGGIILDTWSDERSLDRRLTDIRSYAFSFLVQSFLPGNRANTGTPQANSPVTKDVRVSGEGDVDMKEIDGLLSEAAVMLGRWALYTRFVATKAMDPPAASGASANLRKLGFPTFLAKSALHSKISKILVEPFNTMSTFFLRRSIERAFQLDEQPSGLSLNLNKPLGANAPFITSAVDDVMYIVKQVLQRALATSQRSVITGVFPTLARILGSDFVGMIQRKMRDDCYPRAIVPGGLPPEDKTISFLVLLNNLDVANEYIKRITTTLLGTSNMTSDQENGEQLPSFADLFPFDDDATVVQIAVASLQSSFQAKSTELLEEAISVTFSEILKPRMRPILADAFRDIDYDLSSGSSTNPDVIDAADNIDDDSRDRLVRARFERGWDALTRPIARILTLANFDRLLYLTISYLARTLEKRIWSFYGRVDEIGAIRLERDVAGIVAAAVKGARYGLRDAFNRCMQMVMIMNMEDDEWDDVKTDGQSKSGKEEQEQGGSGIVWVLDLAERQRARGIVKARA